MRLVSILIAFFSLNVASADTMAQRPRDAEFIQIVELGRRHFHVRGLTQVLCYDTNGNTDLLVGGVEDSYGRFRLLFNVNGPLLPAVDQSTEILDDGLLYRATVENRSVVMKFNWLNLKGYASRATLGLAGRPMRTLSCFRGRV